ncbi:phenylalanine--tRNA ligase subunit beta [Candidatus Azambacteria bacterium]|nr:phenylalanine--tRNA ligase subunit beta [Candidatus Azambacteria bacterium]
MKISYNWLKEYINLKEKPEKVADILTMHAFEVESVRKSGNDSILEIDILPNRAHDCLSHIGVARELGALLERKVKFEISKVKENKKLKIGDYISVDVKEKELCERYTARVILNLRVGPSPQWLKERLEAFEQNSINNVVDATNYVMLLLGQPLHAFDLDKIKNGKIVVGKAKKDELIETLGGDKYILDSSVLTIRGEEGALAIAGIKGGKKAEIDENTKNIVLESAYFNPANVRKTSKKLNLRTDSSVRFENEISKTLCREALDLVAGLILEIAGGDLVSGAVDTGLGGYQKTKIAFTIADIQKVIGVDISEKECLLILKRLGFGVLKASKKGVFMADVPFERLDISLKEDLVEEVVRVYGYENIEAKPIVAELWPAERNDEYFYADYARNILTGLGFSDAYNYSFVGKKETGLFDNKYKNLVGLLNPLSEDKKFLRPTLLFHLLNNVYENLKHQKHVRIFEIGNVFSTAKAGEVSEKNMLGGIVAYKAKMKEGAETFYELKGMLEIFFERLGISDMWIDGAASEVAYSHSGFWHSHRAAEVKIGEITVGVMGEISHSILKKLDIETRVAAFEIDFSKVITIANEKHEYRPISKFPAVTRDLAILTDKDVQAADVEGVIEEKGGTLLVDVDLFDIYEDESLDVLSQKSLAFHLIFQSEEGTLSDREVDEIFDKIKSGLKENGWEMRG